MEILLIAGLAYLIFFRDASPSTHYTTSSRSPRPGQVPRPPTASSQGGGWAGFLGSMLQVGKQAVSQGPKSGWVVPQDTGQLAGRSDMPAAPDLTGAFMAVPSGDQAAANDIASFTPEMPALPAGGGDPAIEDAGSLDPAIADDGGFFSGADVFGGGLTLD